MAEIADSIPPGEDLNPSSAQVHADLRNLLAVLGLFDDA